MLLLSFIVIMCMSVLRDMKNAVIGNNKQKANLIVLGAVPRYVSAHLSTSTPSYVTITFPPTSLFLA